MEKENKKYQLFSNGTECMVWQESNCEKCIKAVFYNDKLLIPPNYDMKRRFLSGLDNGWTTIFRFDKTTKIEIESIPQRTEIGYIFS